MFRPADMVLGDGQGGTDVCSGPCSNLEVPSPRVFSGVVHMLDHPQRCLLHTAHSIAALAARLVASCGTAEWLV